MSTLFQETKDAVLKALTSCQHLRIDDTQHYVSAWNGTRRIFTLYNFPALDGKQAIELQFCIFVHKNRYGTATKQLLDALRKAGINVTMCYSKRHGLTGWEIKFRGFNYPVTKFDGTFTVIFKEQ